MLEYRQVKGAVRGKLGGAQEGRLGAVGAGHRGNFLVIRRNDHPVDVFGLQARLDTVSDQRVPGKRLDILAWNPLGPPTRRDDRQNFRLYHTVQPPSTTTLPPVM